MIPDARSVTVSALAVIALSLAAPRAARAQARSLDRGVLMILQDGKLVGREEFAVRRGTTSATLTGFTLASTALYPADRPEHTLVSVIELGPDSFPQTSRFERSNADALRVAIGIGPRRIAVRRATASGESAREYPARTRPLLLDDSVFVSLAVRPPTIDSSRTLTMDGEFGETVEVRHRGPRATTFRGHNVEFDLVLLQTPAGPLSAWYDAKGRLMKIEWPARRLNAIREDEP